MRRLERLQDARWLRHSNRVATIVWIAMLPVIVLTPLGYDPRFVAFTVDYGIVLAHWSLWQSARAEDPTKEAVLGQSG